MDDESPSDMVRARQNAAPAYGSFGSRLAAGGARPYETPPNDAQDVTRSPFTFNSPLNNRGVHLRHPGMSGAAETPSGGHDESDILGNGRGSSPEDEDLDLEGQESEVGGYESGNYAHEREGDEDDEGLEDEEDEDEGLVFDHHPPGLKEISNLGKFTVSTHKQDSGVEELRSEDLSKFWQSDGTQPHNLTVYFIKKVAIREIRFYVDYDQDESYTPTRIIFRSGTSENNMLRFASMDLVSPKGWQKVPLEGVGGGPDGNTLFCWVLQVSVMENHQNGKDTHLRGIKIFAVDVEEGVSVGGGAPAARLGGEGGGGGGGGADRPRYSDTGSGDGGGTGGGRRVPDLSLAGEFLREPELR
ncbi:uncharacterized protein DNG_06522 [Cephalotrichum gorgonifer]|uniref:DOC domain-containing protein n=1 Tax=Cephalotrichum gorgonifer TaxID=2041049 RepID=A0AAE8SWP3_9PEZI|nr:uncharacterized protein DNG_06522 [Cephalotrichum gorgonifer]